MNTAILFDTMSIQQYVFGSNKLKDNLGASYIIEHIYDYFSKSSYPFQKEIDIGYIGGGNALIFTTNREKAIEIVSDFTLRNLYEFPGVSVAVAIKEDFDKESENYKEKIKEHFVILAENKGTFLPVSTISSHGITDTCRFSSLSVEKIETINNEVELLSSSVVTKRIYEKEAREDEKMLLLHPHLKVYSFPNEFEKLGQRKKEDSHIAIVHIDGNEFGDTFRNLNSIKETRKLSERVKDVVLKSFENALLEYCQNEKIIKKELAEYNFFENLLPIRPIVLGGDDVTFVCHGKLGLWFAEKYMEKFNSYFIDNEEKQPFSSCAGVAIVNAKYPFYRAYKMAEELCMSAKTKRRKWMEDNDNEKGGNWIDFQFAFSGLGNTLEEMRDLQYRVKGMDRPYQLQTNSSVSFENLKELASKLKETLPNSKIKDLRELLAQSESSLDSFFYQINLTHKDEILGNFGNALNANEFPYFDMIELIELYPENLLK